MTSNGRAIDNPEAGQRRQVIQESRQPAEAAWGRRGIGLRGKGARTRRLASLLSAGRRAAASRRRGRRAGACGRGRRGHRRGAGRCRPSGTGAALVRCAVRPLLEVTRGEREGTKRCCNKFGLHGRFSVVVELPLSKPDAQLPVQRLPGDRTSLRSLLLCGLQASFNGQDVSAAFRFETSCGCDRVSDRMRARRAAKTGAMRPSATRAGAKQLR